LQLHEEYKVKGKKVCFGFMDLEKASDKVPRKVICWAMRKLDADEWFVLAVMTMYMSMQVNAWEQTRYKTLIVSDACIRDVVV